MATFTNQATLSYNDVTVNSNIATGEIRQVLSLTKTAVSDTYTVGGTETYVVSIVNTGTAPQTNLTVTDTLGAYPFGDGTLVPLTYVEDTVLYYVNGVPQAAPVVAVEDDALVISGINVPADGNVTLIYEVTVNRYAPPTADGAVTNCVAVAGSCACGITEACETVTAAAEPVLSITKDITPDVVTENCEVTYTFTIYNTGNAPADAADNAVVSDLFNPLLSNLTVTFEGESWTQNVEYTYNETTGQFATAAGQITLPAATFAQDPDTGAWTTTPGAAVLTVTGTIGR